VDNLNNEQTSPIESVIAGWQQRMRPRTIGLQVGYEF
jgi:hypothetical protein